MKEIVTAGEILETIINVEEEIHSLLICADELQDGHPLVIAIEERVKVLKSNLEVLKSATYTPIRVRKNKAWKQDTMLDGEILTHDLPASAVITSNQELEF